jgi:hypothetical protein
LIIGFGKAGKTLANIFAKKVNQLYWLKDLIWCMVAHVLTLLAFHQKL